MKRLTRRFSISVATFGIVALVFVGWHAAHGMTLSHPNLVSGWGLLGLCLFLTLYNVRKKLSFLPTLSSALWLQLHIYAGLLAVLLFALHIGLAAPSGPLETVLFAQFTLVAASGLVGLYISRRFPSLLATRGEEVIFERIPRFIAQLRGDVQELVLASAREADSTAIPDFYERSLHGFLDRPRHLWLHLRESQRPLQRLLGEIDDLGRYLTPEEKDILASVQEHVRTKDDLDYHYAHQALLKYWLFIHIPLAWSLVILALLHVLLVHAFGGIR